MNKLSEDELKKYHHFKIKTGDGIELDLIETKYYEELLDLYKQEKEKNKQVTKIANEYKSWWINLGNEIKHIRDKAELMDYYGLVDVIKDLNKLIGDEEDD